MDFILHSYIKIEIFNPLFLLLLLSLSSVLSTEQPNSASHYCNSSMGIPFAVNGNKNAYSHYKSSLEKPTAPHFSFRDCGIQEVKSRQGFDPRNHILNLTPTTGDEEECISTRLQKGKVISLFQNLKRNVVKRRTRMVFVCFGCSHISY